MLDKIFSFVSKAIFCFKINRNFHSFFLFVKNSKKYTSKAKKKIFIGRHNNESITYHLNLREGKLPIHIRTYTGDFDIFYEVFWKKMYAIPKEYTLKKYDTIVDLGANIGLTSIFYALEYPDAKIFALEAEEDNYKLLKENCLFSNRIFTKHGAVNIENGIVHISSPDLSYNFKVTDETSNTINPVQGYDMFSLMNLFNITQIDLLKIDIEGMEQFILSENNEWLSKVNSIIIELHKPYEIKDLSEDLSVFDFHIVTPSNSNHLKMIYAIKK